MLKAEKNRKKKEKKSSQPGYKTRNINQEIKMIIYKVNNNKL